MADFARHITAAQAVRDVMTRMGQMVGTGSISASNVQVVQQMWALANEIGEELMAEYKWPFVKTAWELTTIPGTVLYDLPDDFDMFIASAAWNRDTTFPMLPDVSEPQWQMLKAGPVTATLNVVYRIVGDQIELLNDSDTAVELVLPYQSRGWAVNVDGGRMDNVSADTDIVLYDETLFKAALKRAFFIEKKFDTTRVEYAYVKALEAAKSKLNVGKVIGLVPNGGVPLLGAANLPETGYGSIS